MSISLLLDMAAAGSPERTVLVSGSTRVTAAELNAMSHRAAGLISSSQAGHVAYVGTGGAMLPLLLFGSAKAGRAFTPLNYRLGPAALGALIDRLPDPLIVADAAYSAAVKGAGRQIIDSELFFATVRTDVMTTPAAVEASPDDLAVVLFTSGTTAQPKAVELTHANLTSYVMGTVEFDSAEPGDAALICVPPYHIAGVGAALSNLYAGRKMVYQPQFDAAGWIRLVNDERITNATVVPTMLDRIVTELRRSPSDLPTLRTLAYGGSKAPQPLVRATLELLPHAGLVNAYGLTETSSTIAVLTPEEHREAFGSTDPAVARRLSSAGRAVPDVELQIRRTDGTTAAPDEAGELYVRGPQISGVYSGLGSVLDEQGWFPTKDRATVDAGGYLFVLGRADDTIIRGGENIAPAELEDTLVEHPHVHDVAVVGAPDPQWGQIIVAVVVPAPGSDPDPDELRTYVRTHLRGSRTPDRVVFRSELPSTPTGKVLRRTLVEELSASVSTTEEAP